MSSKKPVSNRNPLSSRGSTHNSEHRSQSCSTLTPETIADQLQQRLLALSYPAFARCLCVLLEALGYEEVKPTGRREWKGYNRPGGGGYDLEAILPGGLAPRRVVAQIKQFDGLKVHQRSVDELRGACLRTGAVEAILVTTSTFSQVVRKHAADLSASSTPVAPVCLIDGKELLRLLIRHRLGVRETGMRVRAQGGAYRLELDEAFFKHLSASGPEVDLRGAAKPSQKASEPQRAMNSNEDLRWDKNQEWKMTIYLSGNSGPATEETLRGGR